MQDILWAWHYVFLIAALILASTATIFIWKIDVEVKEWNYYNQTKDDSKSAIQQHINGKDFERQSRHKLIWFIPKGSYHHIYVVMGSFGPEPY